MLRDAGRAVATVNAYLSALKGVAGEAWMLKLMDVESYQHIRAVRQVRGSALPRGRALQREEIRELFAVCEADTGSITGVRDAALLAIILGCGLRRSEAVAPELWKILSLLAGHLKMTWKRQQGTAGLCLPDSALAAAAVLGGAGSGGRHRAAAVPRALRRHDVVTECRLTDQAVYHILQVRQRQAGLEKCAPHDLRRTLRDGDVWIDRRGFNYRQGRDGARQHRPSTPEI